ncbi:MAG: potassium transporter TrkG, partial [Pseudomonadota bacterium]
MTALVFYLAALGAILSGSMIFPALVAFGFQEFGIGYRMLMYGASGGFLCTAILLSILGRVGGLSRNSAVVLALTCWTFFPILMAFPVSDIAQISFIDALFQTVSSFTTSGSYVFANGDAQPRSLVYLLSQFQWMGGFATLVTLILVLAPWEIGGLPQVASASVAASIVASQKRLVAFCSSLFRFYLVLTLTCFFLLVFVGISPFNSMLFSFSALSTGAVLQGEQTFDILLGQGGMLIVAIFLLVGATSVFWQMDIFQLKFSRLRRHR